MTEQEVVNKLVPIYEGILMEEESAKSILSDAKKEGLDHTALAKIAKAKASDKLGDLKDKTSGLLTMIEKFDS